MPQGSRQVDYETYVAEQILNGNMTTENMFYLVEDLISELSEEDEDKRKFKDELVGRLDKAKDEIPIPLPLLLKYVSRDSIDNMTKEYIHENDRYTLSDFIIKVGNLKHALFTIYRKIMKVKNVPFTIYGVQNVGRIVL